MFNRILIISHPDAVCFPSTSFHSPTMDEQNPGLDDTAIADQTLSQPARSSARTRSLVLAAFPWLHGQIINADRLTEVVGTDQLSTVSP